MLLLAFFHTASVNTLDSRGIFRPNNDVGEVNEQAATHIDAEPSKARDTLSFGSTERAA